MLALASLTKSVCVLHYGSVTALLCAAQWHVQASSIRAVLSAGGLRMNVDSLRHGTQALLDVMR